MKLSEILKENFIIADLSSRDKQGVLTELAKFLEEKDAIKSKDTLFASLMERESLGSTGIGENVAIPHAKSEETENIITLFGRSLKGIDFDSLDQKPVHFVCLLIAPSNSTGLHLKALARISRLFKSQSLREEILMAENVDKIYSLLVEEDSKFS
jgi:PTS system nitrogen regulatory IIA component